MKKKFLQTCHLFLIMDLTTQLTDHLTFLLPVVHCFLTSLGTEIYVVGVLVIMVYFFAVFVSPEIVVEQ